MQCIVVITSNALDTLCLRWTHKSSATINYQEIVMNVISFSDNSDAVRLLFATVAYTC